MVIPPDASSVEAGEEPDDVPSLGQETQSRLHPLADGGPSSRINLRIPDQLRARIEESAAQESLSVNAWLVRTAAAALEEDHRKGRGAQRAMSTRRKYVGWVG